MIDFDDNLLGGFDGLDIGSGDDLRGIDSEYTPIEYETTISDDTYVDSGNECTEDKYIDTNEEGIIAYLVIDRPVHGLLEYFRGCGIAISNIFTDIVDARNAVLMQSEPCRIVVVDTGLGRFTTTKTRQELIDMLGICDESNKVSVYYTDSVIKIDSMRALGKNKAGIDWRRYKGTASVVANLLQYGDKYSLEYGSDAIEKDISESIIYSKIGLSGTLELDKNIAGNIITSELINKHLIESDEGLLENYKVRI